MANVILVGIAKGVATDFEGNYIIKDIDKNLIKFFGFIKNDATIIFLILVAIHHDKLN